MLSLDLFDSKYERRLHEGAVDDLEQHRIDILNDRMQELLARAKESRYKNDPAALAGLKKQYQKIKDERDSYYKIREAQKGQDVVDRSAKMKALTPAKPGMAGAVKDVAQGLKNFLQGKPETGPTYESQKKNSEKVNEYISMGSDKNYQEAEPYKNYKIYVRRKPFGNTGIYTAHTEIDRKEFMGKGPSQEEAVQALRDRIDFVLNAQRKVTGSSTIDFNVKFATDLLADPRQTFYAKLENINGEPKLIIAGADIASDPELLAAGDFKRSTLRNQVDDEGRATPLPGIPLTAKGLRSGDWIANGRYTIGKETQDRDGNRVFDLTYHSTAHTKSDKLRLNQPAFTLGTAREVDEHGGGIGPRQHWQDLMQEEEQLIEGIRDTASATAVIACLLTGGSLTGCATAPQQTTAQQVLKTGQDLGRTVQSAKKITRASAEAEVNQEIRNILRGINRPEELNNSNILRIWKRIKGAPPVQPEPQAPEYGPAEPIKRSAIQEDNASEAAEQAILKRIMVAHLDLLQQYGPEKVMQAAEEVAYNVGDLGEIGTSDVSGWVKQVKQILGATS